MENKVYFTKIRNEYQLASDHSSELYQNISHALEPNLKGVVIDFGNGGIINYDTSKLKKVICIDIINEEKHITDNKIDHIYGDFYNFELDSQADCFLLQFLLHHLTDNENISLSLRKLKEKLDPDGKLLIVEIDLPGYAESIQSMVMPLLNMLLSLLKKPHVRFFSSRTLVKLVTEAGFSNIETQTISIGKTVSPAPVLFPGLKIPGKLYPFNIIMLKAEI